MPIVVVRLPTASCGGASSFDENRTLIAPDRHPTRVPAIDRQLLTCRRMPVSLGLLHQERLTQVGPAT